MPVLQVFVVYFLNFPKNKNDRSAKTDQYNSANGCITYVIYNFLHVHTLPEELELSLQAQQACHSTNLATDPLQILIPSFLCSPA